MVSPVLRELIASLLNKTSVPIDVEPEKLINHINAVHLTNLITFSEEDLPVIGANHEAALYVTVTTKGKRVPRVLVDGGSSVNVMPLATARRLGLTNGNWQDCGVVMKGYDSNATKVLGKAYLKIKTGPTEVITPFLVIDIPPDFNLLLGRPWLHAVRGIASTLHQKIKLYWNDQSVTIEGDKKAFGVNKVSTLGDQEEVKLSRFTCEERVTAIRDSMQEAGKKISLTPDSNPNFARWLARRGYIPGLGLGCCGQGITEFRQPEPYKNREGLGYGRYNGAVGEEVKFVRELETVL